MGHPKKPAVALGPPGAIEADRTLQIFGAETGVFRDAREHFGADFNAVVKCPNIFATCGMR